MNTSRPGLVLGKTAQKLLLTAGVCIFFLGHFTFAASLPTKVGDLDSDNEPTVYDLVRLINYLHGDASVLPAIPSLTTAEKEEIIDVNGDGVIDLRDVDTLGDAILGLNSLRDFPFTTLSEASPAHGEESVSPARTVILRFSRRITPATLSSNSVYLIANGARLAGRLELSSTERFATFFPQDPFPASTEIRLVVEGSLLLDRWGRPVAASLANAALHPMDQGNSADFRYTGDFRTLPLFRIAGTAVSGYVCDSYRTNADGSSVPIIGATIRVDAFPEANAVTDSRGYFTLVAALGSALKLQVSGTYSLLLCIQSLFDRLQLACQLSILFRSLR